MPCVYCFPKGHINVAPDLSSEISLGRSQLYSVIYDPESARLVPIGSSVAYVTYNLYSACIGRLKGSANSPGKGCHGNDLWILQSAVSLPPLILRQNDPDSFMSLLYSSALFPNSGYKVIHTQSLLYTHIHKTIFVTFKSCRYSRRNNNELLQLTGYWLSSVKLL